MAVTDRLTPEGKRIKEELSKLEKLEVFVGFQQGKAAEDDDGTDICDIAAWNEFGTSKGIPARPFVRFTYDHHGSEIQQNTEAIAGQVIDGSDADTALRQLGTYGAGLMQKTIVDDRYEPNKASTKRKKGSDKPLIDTGRMRQSVHYVVRKKGSS